MGDEKGKDRVAPMGTNNFEREWKDYQRLSPDEKKHFRQEVGILRDAKSGKEFYDYVRSQIASVASASDKEVCARNITKEILKDPRYLTNAVTDRDGRRGLSILTDDYRGGGPDRDTIRRAMSKEKDGYRTAHEETFAQNFERYSQEFKKEVEKQGQYEVERVYFVRRDLPSSSGNDYFYEIRAGIGHLEKHETMKGETRKTPGMKEDIRVAVFDRNRGDFVPEHYMYRKDAPLQQTIGDAVAEGVVTLGISAIAKAAGNLLKAGGTAVAKGITKELAKDSIDEGAKKFVSSGEKIIEKGLPGGLEKAAVYEGAKKVSGRAKTELDLSKAIRREASASPDRKVDAFAKTELDLSKIEKRISTPGKPPSGGGRGPPVPPPSGGGPPTESLLTYSDKTVQYLGKDAVDKAAKMGIDEERLGRSIWLAEARAMMKKGPIASELYERGLRMEGFPSAREAVREIVRKDLEKAYSLGDKTARRLVEYGFDPHDIARLVDGSAAKGFTANEIKQLFANELKLMDYYRNRFAGGSLEKASAALAPRHSAYGDVYANIRSEIQKQLTDKYKRQIDVERVAREWQEMRVAEFGASRAKALWDRMPEKVKRQLAWDALPKGEKSQIYVELAEKANKIADRLVKRVLGPSSGALSFSTFISHRREIPRQTEGKEEKQTKNLESEMKKQEETRKKDKEKAEEQKERQQEVEQKGKNGQGELKEEARKKQERKEGEKKQEQEIQKQNDQEQKEEEERRKEKDEEQKEANKEEIYNEKKEEKPREEDEDSIQKRFERGGRRGTFDRMANALKTRAYALINEELEEARRERVLARVIEAQEKRLREGKKKEKDEEQKDKEQKEKGEKEKEAEQKKEEERKEKEKEKKQKEAEEKQKKADKEQKEKEQKEREKKEKEERDREREKRDRERKEQERALKEREQDRMRKEREGKEGKEKKITDKEQKETDEGQKEEKEEKKEKEEAKAEKEQKQKEQKEKEKKEKEDKEKEEREKKEKEEQKQKEEAQREVQAAAAREQARAAREAAEESAREERERKSSSSEKGG